MKKWWIASVGVVGALGAWGVSRSTPRPLPLEGTVTKVWSATPRGGSLQVDGWVGKQTLGLVNVSLGPNTPVWNGRGRVGNDALRAGQRVRVRLRGGIRESYPAQADAAQVEILP